MDTHIIWAIVLLGIALLLFFLEFFIPSAGMLAVSSFVCLVAGVFFLFKYDTTVGMIGAIVSVASLPFLFAIAIKTIPNTPVFRMISLKSEPRPGLGEHGIAGAEAQQIAANLVGKTGRTVTDLRPVGACLIENQRMDCIAASGVIRAGTAVRVVSADGIQVKVVEAEV